MLRIRYTIANKYFNWNTRNSPERETVEKQPEVSQWVSSQLNKDHLEKRSVKQSELIGLLIADLLSRDPSQLEDVLAILEPDGYGFELVSEQ